MACVSKRHEYPMLMAVSCLSPVNTQILISALSRSAILSGTPCTQTSSVVTVTASANVQILFNKYNLCFIWQHRPHLLTICSLSSMAVAPIKCKSCQKQASYLLLQSTELASTFTQSHATKELVTINHRNKSPNQDQNNTPVQ